MTHRILLTLASTALLLILPACSSEGSSVYRTDCAGCHERGAGGAPATGNSRAWQRRLPQGAEVLTARAIAGYKGETGFMPPRGGNPRLTDEQMRAAVTYMMEKSR